MKFDEPVEQSQQMVTTLESPSNEKLEHRSVLCNEREREPLHTQLVMRVT